MEQDKTEYINNILCIWCKDVHRFINYLSSTNSLWKPDPMRWVFRGQGHSKWNLIPTAFRKNTKISFSSLSEGPASDLKKQIEFEWELLYHFVWFADEIGLQIPGNGNIFRDPHEIESIVKKSIEDSSWPPIEILEVMALAQHHGIPTRLIDFTRTSLYAAFFAAQQSMELDVEKEINDLGNDYGNHGLCVWAVDREIKNISNNRIHEHTVPRNGNHFLHAQNGMFFYDKEVNNIWVEKGKYPALEDVIANLPRETPKIYDKYCVKLILPFHLRHDLLRTLRMNRITMAHLMPTYDGVVKTLNWQRDHNLLGLLFNE